MIQGKKIVIFGFGKEGVASANFLGKNNQITVIDEKSQSEIDREFFKKLKIKNVDFYFRGGLPRDLHFDYLIRSPAVRLDNPIIKLLAKNGAVLTSATKIFFDECPGKIIGVTGTKGKGTTATLIYEMLKTQFDNAFLAGNIGTPALEILPEVNKESVVILELSSFQLIDLQKSPQIAVVLLITSEHLDWHKNTDDYQKAKEPIVTHQVPANFAIVNQDYPASKNLAQKTQGKVFFVSTKTVTNGVFLKNGSIDSNIGGQETICQVSDILIPGRHNLENVIAACAVAKINQVENENIVKVLSTFKGLPHRLQLVGEINGVQFYNDSYSTIPETAIAAIEAFSQPKVLILGGSSKKSDFAKLGQKIHDDGRIKAVVLIGREAARIKKAIEDAGPTGALLIEGAKNMHQIANLAYKEAKAGDVVILSPACASLDMFKNYHDRGMRFIEEVKSLK